MADFKNQQIFLQEIIGTIAKCKPGVVVHTYNLTRETEGGGLQV
jgi:hypothetical protein